MYTYRLHIENFHHISANMETRKHNHTYVGDKRYRYCSIQIVEKFILT